MSEYSPPFIIAIRDAIKKKRKRWVKIPAKPPANYSVKVLRVALSVV